MEMVKRYQKMRNIQRLSGHSKLRSYNLLEHSFMVTALFKEFCKLESIDYDLEVLDAVMNHDLLESETGDLIYPVKNLNEVTKNSWETIEREVTIKYTELAKYTDENIHKRLNQIQLNMLKACDLLELWIFCMEERDMGNKTLVEVEMTCQRLISKFDFRSILLFMRNF